MQITENALCGIWFRPTALMRAAQAAQPPSQIAEGTFDTVLNIYAGGAAVYGAIGAQIALHRKAIAGNTQKRPAFNPDQTEMALIYDTDSGSLLGVMAHRPRDFTGGGGFADAATSLAGLISLRVRMRGGLAFTARASRRGRPLPGYARCGRSRARKFIVRLRRIGKVSLKRSAQKLACR